MERLTIRNSDGTYSQPTHLTFEKMFYKLAEIEDFMEETGINDFAELKRIIITNAVWEQNQDLKNEIIKECKEHQEAMQVADKRTKELEAQLINVDKFIKLLVEFLFEDEDCQSINWQGANQELLLRQLIKLGYVKLEDNTYLVEKVEQ